MEATETIDDLGAYKQTLMQQKLNQFVYALEDQEESCEIEESDWDNLQEAMESF